MRLLRTSLLLAAGVLALACGSQAQRSYWTRFRPVRANFVDHFDEHQGDLDQIEGIWFWERGGSISELTAIVRDSTVPGYGFIALQIPYTAATHGSQRAREYRSIVFAFRRTAADSLYDFLYVDQLGRDMPNETREGTVVVKFDRLWFPGADRRPSEHDRRSWRKIYPSRATARTGWQLPPALGSSNG